MSTHRISGIPVVDLLGRLAGIISKTDITQAVAHGKVLYRNSSAAENNTNWIRSKDL
jgi:CBS domain-containing protein